MYEELASESIICYQKIYDYIKKISGEKPQYRSLDKQRPPIVLPDALAKEFCGFVDKISMDLMDSHENFYGYFLLQMTRKVDFSLASPTGVNFVGGKFVLYFNPLLFLPLTVPQMFTCIQHEILHLISLHLQRERKMRGKYARLVLNIAMDLTVNNYLKDLPPDAVTLVAVNKKYSIELKPYESLEYYAEALQKALRFTPDVDSEEMEEGEGPEDAGSPEEGAIADKFSPASTHDLWEDSDETETAVLDSFLEQYVEGATRGKATGHVANLVKILRETIHELPWQKYLRKMLGSLATDHKNTTARRNRRQPERLDLPGQLRRYQPKLGVALDISGSISDGEFTQAMKEVLALVRTYKQPITVMECDDRLRRVYKVRSVHDLQERFKEKAGTSFSPVLALANREKFDLLVYFTDGQGEKKLTTEPKGYKILWVLSGDGEELSIGTNYGPVKKLHPITEENHILDYYDVDHGGFSMNHQEEITLGNEY